MQETQHTGSIPGSGKSSEEGNGNPLQYSCLENPMDRGCWRAAVHGVTRSRTQLSTDRTHTTNKDLLYSTGNSAQCYVAAWMGGEFGGEPIHVCV